MYHPMLDCQESGHHWPNGRKLEGNWTNDRLRTGQRVLVRVQHCQRGCGRIKICKISASTLIELVKPRYAWLNNVKPEPIGTRVKSELRAMQIEEQK